MGRSEERRQRGRASPHQDRKRGGAWRYLVGILALLWGTAVFLAYYYTHKPIQPEHVLAMGKLALAVSAWLGTVVTAHWMGGFMRRWCPSLPAEANLAIRTGIGLGGIGLLSLILGALGAFYPPLFWLLLLLGSLLGARGFLDGFREFDLSRPKGAFKSLMWAFVVLMVAISALRSLAPPVAWDSLVYHLTGPKLYLQASGLHHNLDLPYLGFPQWGTMLFTWGMALAGPSLAQLLHFTFMLLTLFLTLAMVRRVVPDRAWFSLAVLLSAPSLVLIASWAYVEWMTLFAAVGALWLLMAEEFGAQDAERPAVQVPGAMGSDQRRSLAANSTENDTSEGVRGPILLAGVLAGLAFSAKYTTIGLVLGLAIVALSRRRSGRDLLQFTVAFGLTAAPYLLKNWALTGNPVYPFFLPGKYWDAHRSFWYSRPGTGLGFMEILFAPWGATVWGVEGGAFEGHPSYGASVGPLLLALIPLVGLYWYKSSQVGRKLVAAAGMICIIVYLQWAAMLAYSALLVQTRLLFMIFPLVATLGALGLEGLKRVSSGSLRADFVLRALVLLSLGLMTFGHLRSFVDHSPFPVIMGTQPVDDYLLQRLGGHYLAIERINDLPASSQITFLWEPRSYYCSEHVHCEPDALLDRWWHLRQHGLTAQEVSERWRTEGTTHVLYYAAGAEAVREAGFDPLDESDWDELDRLLKHELVELIGWENGYTLYRLPSGE